jgi:hypothetical protein
MRACKEGIVNPVGPMDMTPFIVIGPFLVFVIAVIYWQNSRSAAILQKWADDNGYQILQKDYRHFFRGPFFFTTSRHQTVYRVTVCDKTGQERSGWVRCGGWWWGMLSDQATVRWDDVPQIAKSSMRDQWLDA